MNDIKHGKSLYDRMGGEPVVLKFVHRLYDLMDNTSEVAHVRSMHPDDLSHARQRLFEFLSGWLGGPSLYVERHGHPRLRRKHLMFQIDDKERDQWMYCAREAIKSLDIDTDTAEEFHARLFEMASHLRNQEDSSGKEQFLRTMHSAG